MTRKADSSRLDAAVAQAASISRERAQALIMAGKVTVDGKPVTKAGAAVSDGALVEVADDTRFASRGGEKLERALDVFGWAVAGLRCLDVGASTGGFTDCLLQRDAASVTAVDVGYGQLAWRLQNDPRVKVVDRTNFRLVEVRSIGAAFDFVAVDVSFISLTKIAKQVRASARDGAHVIALVKPQFEVGRAAVGRGGVVREAASHVFAIESVARAFAGVGLVPLCATYSPIKGPAGNIEFLLGCDVAELRSANDVADSVAALDAAGVVAAAHEMLD